MLQWQLSFPYDYSSSPERRRSNIWKPLHTSGQPPIPPGQDSPHMLSPTKKRNSSNLAIFSSTLEKALRASSTARISSSGASCLIDMNLLSGISTRMPRFWAFFLRAWFTSITYQPFIVYIRAVKVLWMPKIKNFAKLLMSHR